MPCSQTALFRSSPSPRSAVASNGNRPLEAHSRLAHPEQELARGSALAAVVPASAARLLCAERHEGFDVATKLLAGLLVAQSQLVVEEVAGAGQVHALLEEGPSL